MIVTALVLTWIILVLLGWLGWQLLRQNGRLLLRIESMEARLNEMEFSDASASEGLPVGSVAPEFDLPALNGGRQTLTQLRTQPLLLIFFNPDCGYCRELMPKLAELAPLPVPPYEPQTSPRPALSPPSDGEERVAVGRERSGSGGQYASLSAESLPVGRGEARRSPVEGPPLPFIVTTGDPEKNRQFFAEHKFNGPVLVQNDSEVAKSYQANGTPTGYLISAEGKIASELAIGAEALLKLAESAPLPQPLSHPMGEGGQGPGEGDRTNRFSNRSLARSRIARNGLKAGTPAPPFRLPRLDGRGELALEDLRGQRVLLVFSDPHCGPCDALAPRLEQLHRERPELRVVMISRGEPRDNRAKVKQHKLTFPVVLQQQWEISRRYAMFATPIAYLIDEAGVIARDVALGEEGIMNLAAVMASQQRKEAR